MRRVLAYLCVLGMLAVTGCAAPGPSFSSAAATIPPVPPGQARIYIYRWLEPYESSAETTAAISGQPAAVTQTGTVLYRDVAPGPYTISVRGDYGYPNQSTSVTLQPGETVYARIDAQSAWTVCADDHTCPVSFAVLLVYPTVALGEMQGLRLIHG